MLFLYTEATDLQKNKQFNNKIFNFLKKKNSLTQTRESSAWISAAWNQNRFPLCLSRNFLLPHWPSLSPLHSTCSLSPQDHILPAWMLPILFPNCSPFCSSQLKPYFPKELFLDWSFLNTLKLSRTYPVVNISQWLFLFLCVITGLVSTSPTWLWHL